MSHKIQILYIRSLLENMGDTAIVTNALDSEITISLVIKFTLTDAELKMTDVKSEHAMVMNYSPRIQDSMVQ